MITKQCEFVPGPLRTRDTLSSSNAARITLLIFCAHVLVEKKMDRRSFADVVSGRGKVFFNSVFNV